MIKGKYEIKSEPPKKKKAPPKKKIDNMATFERSKDLMVFKESKNKSKMGKAELKYIAENNGKYIKINDH